MKRTLKPSPVCFTLSSSGTSPLLSDVLISRFAFEFDYSREVISVRVGGSLPKESKGWHLMQNNSLCVEEPFNTSRNLGNTADEATVKGLQLEFRRAVHYLADHASLELACWPYQFPTSENPRPERHLPNLPPQFSATVPSNHPYKKKQYFRPHNSSPPFKSPKTRTEDGRGAVFQSSSFGGSRQQYPFNPLNLNPPMMSTQGMPIPSTPQSGMSSNMSSAGDIHHAYPPTPSDQLNYVDPFKNRQFAYYIPAFAPNGLQVYVPYSEDPVVYASPPQTPAMSETSLSHQPQYPRSQPFMFPQQYSHGQSVQRGRTPHRVEEVGSPTMGFRDPSASLTGTGINTAETSAVASPYIPTQIKRRNSLPPNNKPNVANRPVKSTAPMESFTPDSSATSQGLAGSISSIVDSDAFEEEFFGRGQCDGRSPSSETPSPSTNKQLPPKVDVQHSPGRVKDAVTTGGLPPAGKSYAAALLNAGPAIKSPIQPAQKDSLATPTIPLTNCEKRKSNSKIPPLSLDTTTPSSPAKKTVDPVASSPAEVHTRPCQPATTVWNNGLHLLIEPTSPIVQTRRPSTQSVVSTSPRKAGRVGGGRDTRGTTIIQIPELAVQVDPNPPTTAKRSKRNKKNPKKKENNETPTTSTTIGVASARRQSVATNA